MNKNTVLFRFEIFSENMSYQRKREEKKRLGQLHNSESCYKEVKR